MRLVKTRELKTTCFLHQRVRHTNSYKNFTIYYNVNIPYIKYHLQYIVREIKELWRKMYEGTVFKVSSCLYILNKTNIYHTYVHLYNSSVVARLRVNSAVAVVQQAQLGG